MAKRESDESFEDILRQYERKFILKTILAKYLPTDLWNRPKKGFGIPIDTLLKSKSLNLGSFIFDSKNPLDDFLDMRKVVKILNDKNRTPKYNRILWHILCFQIWRSSWQK